MGGFEDIVDEGLDCFLEFAVLGFDVLLGGLFELVHADVEGVLLGVDEHRHLKQKPSHLLPAVRG